MKKCLHPYSEQPSGAFLIKFLGVYGTRHIDTEKVLDFGAFWVLDFHIRDTYGSLCSYFQI